VADNTRPDIDSLWDFGDPAGTEAKFKALLIEVDNYPVQLELLTQIARTFSLRLLFEQAHEILDQVEQDLDQATPMTRVRYLLERGRCFNSAGRQAEAIAPFKEALDIARREGLDYYAVDAAHMLGIAAPLKERLSWNRQAMAMAEASRDQRTSEWLGPLYNNTGWTYIDMGDYPAALELFQKGVAFRAEKGEGAPLRIARWTVAHTRRLLGEPEQALALLSELEQDWLTAGSEDGYVYEDIAECLLILDRTDEARPYFAKAYTLLSQDAWLQGNEQDRLRRLQELSKDAV
jgi:tetratricopeptide (TPR) repeat protein